MYNCEVVKNRMKKLVRIRINESEFNSVIDDVFRGINLINSIDETDEVVDEWNRDLKDIMIPNELSCFIVPRSIRVDPLNLQCSNLLLESKFDVDGEVTHADFVNSWSRFRGYYRLDASQNLVSIADLKKDVSLFDVISTVSVGDRSRYIDRPFVPIHVSDRLNVLFKPGYLNVESELLFIDFMSQWKV